MSPDRAERLEVDADGAPTLRRADGTAVAVRPTAARLLAVLVGRLGSTVSTDVLVDGTWGDARPGDVASSLHTTVARLRRLLPEGSVHRDRDGYRLVLPEGFVAPSRRPPIFVPVLAPAASPLIGRDGLLAELSTVPDGGVVFHGSPGVGKSRLVEHLVARAADDGDDAVLLRGRSAGDDVALGVFAPILDVARPEPGLRALVGASEAVVAALDGQRLLLGLDDLHQIDAMSAVLTAQLVRDGHVRLVGAHRNLRWVHPALADLWHDGLVAHLHVPELRRDAVAELMRSFGHEPTPARVDEVWRLTAGNPLFASVLLRAGGSRSDDPTLGALIDELLADLTPELHDTLAVVAVAEPVRVEVLERVAELDALVQLERACLISIETDGTRPGRSFVRVRHPLYGEHIRASMSKLLSRSARSQLVSTIEQIGPASTAERLQMARWALDVGRALTTDAALAAAHDAVTHDEPELARRLSEQLVDREQHPAAAAMLAELAWVDRPGDEVVRLARAAADLTSGRLRARLLGLAARAADHKSGDVVAADELCGLARAADDGVGRSITAELLALRGEGAAALAVIGDVAAALTARRVGDVVSAATAAALVGRAQEAWEWLGEARAWFDDGSLRSRIVRLQLAAVASRPAMMTGRLEEAVTSMRTLLGSHAVAGDRIARATNAVALGGLLPWAGRPAEAMALARDAAGTLGAAGHRAAMRWALMSWGFAGVVARDLGAVTDVLSRLDRVPIPTMTDGVEAMIRGGALALDGRPDDAVAVLAAGADEAHRRGLLFEAACAWHDLARNAGAGTPLEVLARLEGVASAMGGFSEAFVLHASGIAHGDEHELLEAAESFARIGANALAAEAFGRAAEVAATSSLRRARRHVDEADAAATGTDPGIVRRALVSADPVTARERTVAELAADGRSNAEIAARLHISVRTVENHLSRLYLKVGAEGRGDIAALLGRPDPADRSAVGDE